MENGCGNGSGRGGGLLNHGQFTSVVVSFWVSLCIFLLFCIELFPSIS